MKYLIYILPFLFFSQLNAQSYSSEQGRADFQRSRNALTQPVPAHIQKYFDIAINEIDQMLKGEKPLSFKRAVYLVENAYYEGKISWEDYNNEILNIKPTLDKMIDDRNLRQYKTAGNWAVFTYMSIGFAEIINKEVSGYYLNQTGTPEIVSNIYMGRYINNNATTSYKGRAQAVNAMTLNGTHQVHTDWHTHPTYGYSNAARTTASPQDRNSKANALRNPNPNQRPSQFMILTRGYLPIFY